MCDVAFREYFFLPRDANFPRIQDSTRRAAVLVIAGQALDADGRRIDRRHASDTPMIYFWAVRRPGHPQPSALRTRLIQLIFRK